MLYPIWCPNKRATLNLIFVIFDLIYFHLYVTRCWFYFTVPLSDQTPTVAEMCRYAKRSTPTTALCVCARFVMTCLSVRKTLKFDVSKSVWQWN